MARRALIVAAIVLAAIAFVGVNFIVGCSSGSSGVGDRVTPTTSQ